MIRLLEWCLARTWRSIVLLGIYTGIVAGITWGVMR